jgi:uncharacterized membrane protein
MMVLLDQEASSAALNFGSLFAFWASFALISSALALGVFSRARGEQLTRWMRASAPPTGWRRALWIINGGGVISWALTGSFMSLATVLFLAVTPGLRSELVVVGSGVAVVVSSVILIITAYAVRYARQDALDGGAEFPGNDERRFVDYVYLAAQVATSYSSADVRLTTTSMRRAALGQSLICFAFNSATIALLVSVLLTSTSAI